MDVSRSPQNPQSVSAELIYVYNLGSVVRLELRRMDTGEIFEAEMVSAALQNFPSSPAICCMYT